MAKTNAHKYPTCTRNLNINQTNSNWIRRGESERYGIFSSKHNKNQLNDQQRRNKQF